MSRLSMTRTALLMAAGLTCMVALHAAVPRNIAAAVDDASRPAQDRQRDVVRKPGETLAFAGIRPGQLVVELIPGGGYYTRILSRLVGPKGRVYAIVPAPRADAPADAPDRTAPLRALAADGSHGNIDVLVQPIQKLAPPGKVDVVWTSLNYHDVHNVPNIDIAAFNRAMFDALQPGGLYIVIDHAAAAGAPADVTSKLHRVDADVVKREVTAVGFQFVAESPLLANPQDPRTASVFDPSIRGKTAQFILKFRKPRR